MALLSALLENHRYLELRNTNGAAFATDEPEIASLSRQDPIAGPSLDVAFALPKAARPFVLPVDLGGGTSDGRAHWLAGLRDALGTGCTPKLSWITPSPRANLHIAREYQAAIDPSLQHTVRCSSSVCVSRRGRPRAPRFAGFSHPALCSARSKRTTAPRVTPEPRCRAPSAHRPLWRSVIQHASADA